MYYPLTFVKPIRVSLVYKRNPKAQCYTDGEESNHEDASDTGIAPKQQQQVISQTTAISNIKLPILKKEEYDIWAMEIEHYLEYIDNEVWKVIQNGNSKKRISIGKDGVVRVLSPVTAAEIQARSGKQSELGLEKGYDRFQQLLLQLEAHVLKYQPKIQINNSSIDLLLQHVLALLLLLQPIFLKKKVVSSLDFQEEVDTGAEQVNTVEGVSTGSTKLSTGSKQVSTVGDKKSTSSQDKGQREGKAPMISEETPKKSKEQILQEKASLAEASLAEGVNTGSIKLSTVSEQFSTGNEQVSTVGAKKSISSQDKGQREGKAPMLSEETPKKSKEQILQEKASLAEAIRLDSL
ncbi:hypothetical protein Tco_1151781 [Tanacetum coccineum]